ncbi:unnamed protein product [Tilletia controversa]|uniref:Signal peptidase complex subunit 1 n=1 Tax=Tilletia controversa TaxID=13291 RepID=A0A8X7SUH8_9BASI|nr:hypothetical protein CF328_g5694 [Tilletia controversa]KAE8243059.1 hypothetical protein A4X06_0g6580 [Tilletia controversa]CAD6947044.1 unnamed protein product [Tilletia controversa]
MDQIQKIIDGKIDFQGQRLADRIAQETIALFTLVAVVAGYLTASLETTLLIYALGVVLALTASVPPWPMYNKYPVQWLPNRSTSTDTDTAVTSTPTSTSKTAKA